jgi:hypothetical protein
MYPVKQSTTLTVPVFAHDVSGDAVTGLTDGGFTKRISKNGGAFAAMTVTITEMENGWYSVPLSTSHTNTNGVMSITLTHASAKQINLQFRVGAKLTDDLNDVAATDIVSAGAITTLSGAVVNVDTVDTCTTNTDMRGTDSAALAADYTSARAGYLDNLNISENVAGTSEVGHLVLFSGTADSGSTTTLVDAALTEADADYWKGNVVLITSGTSANQVRLITGFTPATDTVTFAPALTQAITTNTYKILPSKLISGVDWANIINPSTAVDLSATDIQLCDTVTTNTDMRGTDSALLAASINLTGGAVDTVTTAVNLTTNNDKTGYTLSAAGVDAIIDETLTSHVTADSLGVAVKDILADTNELQADDYPTSIAAIQADTDDIQTRLPAALIGGRMDSDIEAINNNTTSATQLALSAEQIENGACEGTPSTTVIQTDLAETQDDIYIGRVVIFTSGNARGEATDITDYAGATGTLTVTALANAPAASDTFILI